MEERAKLHTLKMILEIQLESVKEAVLVTQKNLEAYKNLSRFALSDKRQLRAKNCGDVKSVSDENGLTFQENYLEYIKNAREASCNCKDIERSAGAIESASSKLDIASNILIDVLPELIQK